MIRCGARQRRLAGQAPAQRRTLLLAFVDAPRSTSIRVTARLPDSAARCSGVRPPCASCAACIPARRALCALCALCGAPSSRAGGAHVVFEGHVSAPALQQCLRRCVVASQRLQPRGGHC